MDNKDQKISYQQHQKHGYGPCASCRTHYGNPVTLTETSLANAPKSHLKLFEDDSLIFSDEYLQSVLFRQM